MNLCTKQFGSNIKQQNLAFQMIHQQLLSHNDSKTFFSDLAITLSAPKVSDFHWLPEKQFHLTRFF